LIRSIDQQIQVLM